jgi:hypothetical protein
MQYTHIFQGCGQGYPDVGEEVLCIDKNGEHKLLVVLEVSEIHSKPFCPNWVDLVCASAHNDWNNFDTLYQETLLKRMNHVEPLPR